MDDEQQELGKTYYTLPETARVLRRSLSSLYAGPLKDPTFPVARIAGRPVVPVDALRAWVLRQMAPEARQTYGGPARLTDAQ